MRLFTAVTFENEVKQALAGAGKRLEAECYSGNFTPRENLHLTLVFIGETDRLDAAKRAVASVRVPPFEITLQGTGCFRHSGIYWVGARPSVELGNLYLRVYEALEGEGFRLEPRPYTAHVTLGRKVKVRPGFNAVAFAAQVPKLVVPVRGASLMLSSRVDGKLTYTPLEC